MSVTFGTFRCRGFVVGVRFVVLCTQQVDTKKIHTKAKGKFRFVVDLLYNLFLYAAVDKISTDVVGSQSFSYQTESNHSDVEVLMAFVQSI